MAHVQVLYFAVLRERRGRDSERIPITEGITARELYHQIFPPGPQGALPVAYARNKASVSPDTPLADGDELAFLPPLGGG